MFCEDIVWSSGYERVSVGIAEFDVVLLCVVRVSELVIFVFVWRCYFWLKSGYFCGECDQSVTKKLFSIGIKNTHAKCAFYKTSFIIFFNIPHISSASSVSIFIVFLSSTLGCIKFL